MGRSGSHAGKHDAGAVLIPADGHGSSAPVGDRTSDYEYRLPPELIAQVPPPTRDAARMMVLHRATRIIEHGTILDLPRYLAPGDALVMNNTRVIPARVMGRRPGTGGKVELFFLEAQPDGTWSALLRARRRPKPGDRIPLGTGPAEAVLIDDIGGGEVRVRVEGVDSVERLLETQGQTPLPPYIHRSNDAPERPEDRARYQTVYARHPGAVAAPTAGLHFTPELLKAVRDHGVDTVEVTLHVGPGTFRPVTADNPGLHTMDSERYDIPSDAAHRINAARAAGGRILAVGTTTVRTLETAARPDGTVAAGAGRSELFIRPPHAFACVDRLLTNFHLPRSTLLMLVSAFAGREFVLEAYHTAVREKYRFYSFGDCMLIL